MLVSFQMEFYLEVVMLINQLEKKFTKVKFPLSTLNTGFIPCRCSIYFFNPLTDKKKSP